MLQDLGLPDLVLRRWTPPGPARLPEHWPGTGRHGTSGPDTDAGAPGGPAGLAGPGEPPGLGQPDLPV